MSHGRTETLIYGRAPEGTSEVEISRPGGAPLSATLYEGQTDVPGDFYTAALGSSD